MQFAECDNRATFTLLDQPIGRKCLLKVLAIGQERLERQAAGAPDLRFGRREHRSKPGTFTVDAFLQVCYDSIAETLPDQFIRRGRAARRKPDLDDDGPSDFEELDSEVEMEDLKQKANNHKPAAAVALRKLKEAVLQTYGHRYQRACQYLEDLASNTYWEETDLTPLPWHTQDQAPLYPAQARYVMHQAVLDALAPAVPLRAVFARGAHN
ncbi:unnamed protein product [Durusdinium trenchii]|uniref:Uncharacterized protein n=1 Tax=Durusdinium trenchii TaxID=1381693 RepID=A0ABP0J9E8_9DINO